MSALMPPDYPGLKDQLDTNESPDSYFTPALVLKILKREPIYWRNYQGGTFPEGTKLTIKSILSEDDKGRLLYRGRLFDRRRWSWRPPKILRMMGRQARDFTDLRNSYPTEEIEQDDTILRVRAICTRDPKRGPYCDGKLLYDKRYYLYCEKCFLIRNEYHSPTWQENIPGTGNAPMDDHDLSLEIGLERSWTDQGLEFI